MASEGFWIVSIAGHQVRLHDRLAPDDASLEHGQGRGVLLTQREKFLLSPASLHALCMHGRIDTDALARARSAMNLGPWAV